MDSVPALLQARIDETRCGPHNTVKGAVLAAGLSEGDTVEVAVAR